jgi:hypothetical protein
MPKTIILAIATLLLAVAVLVTDLISPYAGGVDSLVSAPPVRLEVQMPVRAPVRTPARVEVLELVTNTAVSTPDFGAI